MSRREPPSQDVVAVVLTIASIIGFIALIIAVILILRQREASEE
jgi:hypothetical protein